MSTLTWIDHSEKQRRQMLDAIDLFREKDTRDELGLAGIRDALADSLFPGTGTVQTRARYFFFVPWMYLDFEETRVSSNEVARKGRAFEIALIERLKSSSHPPPPGVIGIQAGPSLQRIPSNIYWNGMKRLGICLFPGSQAEYHRSLDRRAAAAAAARQNDDQEIVGGAARAWHAGARSAPKDFPSKASFALTKAEAQYLKRRVLENHRRSLFAFMLDRDYQDADADFAWMHPSSQDAPPELRRQIEHAQCFSEVMNGAAILYNLYLGELDPRRDKVIEECQAFLDEWLELMAERREALVRWDRKDFWQLLAEQAYVPPTPTRSFVDEWCRRVLEKDPTALRGIEATKDLIFSRETQIKGEHLARCKSRSARERWEGDAGLGRLDYRWSNARVILRDISDGLAGGHA